MAIYTSFWLVTVTVHGFDDDISMLQFTATNKMTEYEAREWFNERYARKGRSEITDRNVIFPLPIAYDPIGKLYENEDGDLCEEDSHRGARIRVQKANVGRWQ